jgi:hypothetical protein
MTPLLDEFKVKFTSEARGLRCGKARKLPTLLEWIRDKIKEAQQNKEQISRQQLELSIGCDRMV